MNQDRAGDEKPPQRPATDREGVSWGPKLFFGVMVAILVFFYWLLIYSGGVTVHHG
jgi:hypothetical protein